MKSLETTFTLDNHNFTQLKRNDKAALYKRETAEGTFVSFEVFAIMTKNDAEIYPNQRAVQMKWCFCPTSEDRANLWFDRFTNGDVVIPHVDPETGDPLEVADEQSLNEIPDVVVDTNVETPAIEVPAVDPLALDTPVVNPTPDGGAAVTVAKVTKSVVVFNFPTGEFTQADFANANGLPERGVVWSKLDTLVQSGTLTKRFGKTGKGRPKAYFTKVSVADPTPATADAIPATV